MPYQLAAIGMTMLAGLAQAYAQAEPALSV
jgi:hypothetical protein